MKIKLKRKTAKKGGSVLLTKDLDSPLSLTVPPGTKSGDCLFRGMLRKKTGRDVADEYTEIYASVKWFRWWFIPAAIILLTILCNMDCGGKQEEKHTSSKSEASSVSESPAVKEYSEWKTAEIDELIEYAETNALDVFISQGQAMDMTEEVMGEVSASVKAIQKKYLVNDYVPEDKAQVVLDEVWDDACSFVSKGIAAGAARTEYGVTLLFADGNTYNYIVKLEDAKTGYGAKKIVSYRLAHKESLRRGAQDGYYSDIDLLSERYPDYRSESAETYTEEDITVKALLNLEGIDVLVWDGHGGEDGFLGSFLSLEQEYFAGEAEIRELKRYHDTGGRYTAVSSDPENTIGILGNFFKSSFPDNAFEGAFVYLGTCYSGNDGKLADGFLSRGAEVVFGNKGLSIGNHDARVFERLMKGFSEGKYAGELVSEGYLNLISYLGGMVYNLEDLFGDDHQFEELIDSDTVLFGNPYFTFDNDFVYYADGEHSYEFEGTVVRNEDGSYMLALDSYCTARYFEKRIPFCNIYIGETDQTKFAGSELEERMVTGTLLYSDDKIWFAPGVSPVEIIEADPGQNVEIVDIKLFNKLIDFLGESFDKVQEYYGVSEGVIGLDENGECLSYLIDDNYIIFAELYEGTGTVNEIQVIFQNSNAPELLLCSGVSSHMKQADVHSALSEYHSEAHVTSDALTVNASSETANMFFSWNPAATGSMSFVRLEAIR